MELLDKNSFSTASYGDIVGMIRNECIRRNRIKRITVPVDSSDIRSKGGVSFLLSKLEPHKEHVTTVVHWNTYRKENPQFELPSANTLIRHYGSWNNLKQALGMEVAITFTDIRTFTEEEVLTMLQPHVQHLERTRIQWDDYIKACTVALPTSASLITFFGTWNRLKEQLGLSTAPEHRPPTYTKEDIIRIVKQYAPISLSPRKWDTFRKEQGRGLDLPSSQTISKHLSKEEKVQFKNGW